MVAHYVMSLFFCSIEYQEAFWCGLQAGMFQMTVTDHCCFCILQKVAGQDDFRKISNGTGGVEDRMVVLWYYGVRTGKLIRSQYVVVTSINCVQIFNIYLQKGSLNVGADADVVVWDPNKIRTIFVETYYQNIDYNIYEGMEVIGNSVYIFFCGWLFYDNGTVNVECGSGRYVNWSCFGFYWEVQFMRNCLAESTVVTCG